MTIQSGYLLQVISWENDGDYYNTKSIQGLTPEQAKWRIEFLKALALDDSQDESDVPYIEIASKITNGLGIECCTWYDNIPEYPPYNDEDDLRDYYSSIAHDMLGGAEYGRRHLDSYNVYCIREEIPDISNEF